MSDKKKYSSVDEVYKKLKSYLKTTVFDEGEKIPSERQIAEDLSVNRTTLRAAMHKLVEDGFLERKIGSGTFVKVTTEMIKNIDNALADYSPSELIEIRIMLEPQLALIAAANAQSRDIGLLKELSEISGNGTSVIEESDIDFNEHLAKMSGNGLLQRMYLDISTVRRNIKSKKSAENSAKSISFTDAERWSMHQNNVIRALENHLAKAAEEAVKNKLADLLLNQFFAIRNTDLIGKK